MRFLDGRSAFAGGGGGVTWMRGGCLMELEPFFCRIMKNFFNVSTE